MRPSLSDHCVYSLPCTSESSQTFSQTKKKSQLTPIRIMTWNLGWAYGIGSEGTDTTPKSKAFFIEKLRAMAQIIRESNVDFILLQEVDFSSRKSHYIQMAKALAPLAGFQYIAEALSWKINYLPYPGWRVQNHWGKIRSGGAILSKHPILNQNVTLLPKPKKFDPVYRYFYLYRYLQEASIQWGEHTITLVNAHLEAMESKNRAAQAKIACHILNGLAKSRPVLFGGDLNAPPAYEKNKGPFSFDSVSYQDDQSQGILKDELNLNCPVYDQKDRGTCKFDEAKGSFPSTHPDRLIDYLFHSNHWKCESYEILPTGTLSDHLPLLATFRFEQLSSDAKTF